MSSRSGHVRPAIAPTKVGHSSMWIMLAVLGIFLAVALAFSYAEWNASSDAVDHQVQQMSRPGYVAATLAIMAMLALGSGLMTLVFCSDHRGHDQDANADRKKK